MRRPRQFIAIVIGLSVAAAHPAATQTPSPDSARLVTRDIANFWHAIDHAAGKDSAALVAALRTDYLASPSPGLRDNLANVYTHPTELLIGTEMNSRDPSTPMDGLTAWHKAVIGQVADLPHIVAHEIIHTQQPPLTGRKTLLAVTLQEGGADFLSELISGHHIINPAYAYGDTHRAALSAAFAKAMDSTNTSGWLFQGEKTSPGVPADLGYWMGYRITKAYYDHATDKAAVRAILRASDDPHAFLTASGYGS